MINLLVWLKHCLYVVVSAGQASKRKLEPPDNRGETVYSYQNTVTRVGTNASIPQLSQARKKRKNLRKKKNPPVFTPYAYLNKYGQMVKSSQNKQQQASMKKTSNEETLRQFITHCMVCNGLLSKNYEIDLIPANDTADEYVIYITMPKDFTFNEQQKILVEELIYTGTHEKIAVEVADIQWRTQ